MDIDDTTEAEAIAEIAGEHVEAVIAETVTEAVAETERAQETAEQIAAAAIELERAHNTEEGFAECKRMIETTQTELRALLAETYSALQTELATVAQVTAAGLADLEGRITDLGTNALPQSNPPTSTLETEAPLPMVEVLPEAQDDAPAVPAAARKRMRLV
jgi:Tfp pilus assembly major pilin PilA